MLERPNIWQGLNTAALRPMCWAASHVTATILIRLLCYLSLQITWEERWHSILSELDVDVARRYVVQSTRTHPSSSKVLICLHCMCSTCDSLISLCYLVPVLCAL